MFWTCGILGRVSWFFVVPAPEILTGPHFFFLADGALLQILPAINVVSVHVSSVNVTETRVPELPPSGIVPAVYFANPAGVWIWLTAYAMFSDQTIFPPDGVDHTVCIESATLSCARQIEDAVAARFGL